MKIYLDACCINRPYDDQTQDRIRLESEAILMIINHCQSHQWVWIGSDALTFEIQQIPNVEKQKRVQLLASYVSQSIQVGASEIQRSQELQALGFHTIDSLHLACAESGNANVFLTTDDPLLKRALKVSNQLKIRVVSSEVPGCEFGLFFPVLPTGVGSLKLFTFIRVHGRSPDF